MRIPQTNKRRVRRQSASAMIAVLMILTILLIFVMGNVRTLNNLGKEIRLIEQRQRARNQMPQSTHSLEAVPGETNSLAGASQK